MRINKISFNKIVVNPYKYGAINRGDFPGFKEDYLVLYCLIKKCLPLNGFVEVGTSIGLGTNVICKALGSRKKMIPLSNKARVFSIDVPPGTNPTLIYPGKEDGHPKTAGISCYYKYTQLFGDSTNYNYSPYYPIEGWFIDGKHNYDYVKKDTLQALKSDPKLIIWHDKQIEGVRKAIQDTIAKIDKYMVFDVIGTRIVYAVKK